MKRRKDAAEAKVERKRKRKARHDKACKLARAEGKPQPATPESSEEDEEEASDAEDHALRSDGLGARASPPPFYLWDEDEGEPAVAEFPQDPADLWRIKMRPEPGYISLVSFGFELVMRRVVPFS